MKKITLNESDLLKIVKRVLNEQEIKQFDEDEIDILYHIFERELKPPFRKSEMNDRYGHYPYYNRNDDIIGSLEPNEDFTMRRKPCLINIRDKVCQVFGFAFGSRYDTNEWWFTIIPYLKSWLEDQLNIELRNIW